MTEGRSRPLPARRAFTRLLETIQEQGVRLDALFLFGFKCSCKFVIGVVSALLQPLSELNPSKLLPRFHPWPMASTYR